MTLTGICVTERERGHTVRVLDVSIPAAILRQDQTAALRRAQPSLSILGWKPGQVPITHLRKVHGRQFMADAIDRRLDAIVPLIVESTGDRNVDRPVIKMPEGEALEAALAGRTALRFTVTFHVAPPVDERILRSIQIEKPVYAVSQETVDKLALEWVRDHPIWLPSDRPAAIGDSVLVDYDGVIDGQPFRGCSGRRMRVGIGRNDFLPGFDVPLFGAVAGGLYTVDVTFPGNYPADWLAGRTATYAVTVIETQVQAVPEVNDTTAQLLGMKDANDLRNALRSQLEKPVNVMGANISREVVGDALCELFPFDPPVSRVDDEFKMLWSAYLKKMEADGTTFRGRGKNEDDEKAALRVIAHRQVRIGILLQAVAALYGLSLTAEEQDAITANWLEGFPPDERKAMLKRLERDPVAKGRLLAPAIQGRAIEHLLEHVVETIQIPVTRKQMELLHAESFKSVRPEPASIGPSPSSA